LAYLKSESISRIDPALTEAIVEQLKNILDVMRLTENNPLDGDNWVWLTQLILELNALCPNGPFSTTPTLVDHQKDALTEVTSIANTSTEEKDVV